MLGHSSIRVTADVYGHLLDAGIKRVSGFSVRKFITKALTVERAAKIHRVPLEEFLTTLRTAVGQPPTE